MCIYRIRKVSLVLVIMLCIVFYSISTKAEYIVPDSDFSYEIQIDSKGVANTSIIDIEGNRRINYDNTIDKIDYKSYAGWLKNLGAEYKDVGLSKITYVHLTSFDSIVPTTQWDTGKYSTVNCVPTVCAVIANWCTSGKTSLSPNTIRFLYPPKDNKVVGSYSMDDLSRIYTSLGLPYMKSDDYSSPTEFLEYLNKGCLVGMVVDMSLLPLARPEEIVGHTYEGGGQHNIICTGYLTVKCGDLSKLYLEIFDPAENLLLPRYYDVESFKDTLNAYESHYFVFKKL